jgi:aromatic-L-amino-acid decarboxylase
MSEDRPYHMTPDEFRRHGHALVDWIAAYQERVEQFPVLSTVEPGEIRAQLPAAPPENGEPFEQVMADVDRIIMPGVTHWQSPNFFAFFPANASGPAILGELLSAGLGVQGMMWVTSPACTELETHVMDWLVGMLGLPEKFLSSSAGGGVIQDTASSATLCALLAARERATGLRSNEAGVRTPLVAYATAQAHSSVEKAVKIAGLGSENLRLIATDTGHAMRADLLADAIEADLAAGLEPCFVNATVGTTSSNAFDPLDAIGAVCERHGVWLHADAAMSGTAALCPEFRFIHDGLGRADSYCFNPHKWMLTNFDCDCFWVADRAALINTLSILPEYLKNKATQSGAVFDYRDWHIPLGRRFRALKLWFVIRHYGVEGLRRHVREQVGLAQEFAGWVRAHPRLELATEPPLNLVCFRHAAGDDATQSLIDAVNATGRAYMTHARLDDRYTIRFCVGGTSTERRHVEQAWELIDRVAAQQAVL